MIFNLDSNHGLLMPDEFIKEFISILAKCKVVKIPMYGATSFDVTNMANPTCMYVDENKIIYMQKKVEELEKPKIIFDTVAKEFITEESIGEI